MADENERKEATPPEEIEATCPKCGHKFWHKITDGLRKIGDSIGNAIGEAKFGGE